MRNRSIVVAGAVLMLVAQEGWSQETVVCSAGRTLGQCYQEHRPTSGRSRAASNRMTRGAATSLQAQPTGTDLSGEGPLTAVRDYLPRFAAALLAPSLGGDLQSLGAKANIPLNEGKLFDFGVIAQLAAVVNDAQPYEPLLDLVPDPSRENVRSRLTRDLQQFDDISFSGSLNLETRSLGRSIRSHLPDVARIAEGVLPTGSQADRRMAAADSAFIAFRGTVDRRLEDNPASILDPARVSSLECALDQPGGPRDAGEMPIRCFDARTRLEIEEKISEISRAAGDNIQFGEESVRASGMLSLAKLVNNQPQLNGTLGFRSRARLVGPSEWTGTARFEMGFANMNALRRHCGMQETTATCLRTFLDDPQVQRSLVRGDRVWAQVDVTRRQRWHAILADEAVELALEPGTTFAVSAGYGAYLGGGAGTGATGRDRIDVQGKYDIVRDDPLRQNRFLATLVYTLPFSDQTSALLGLTYASRPEFIGDVDRRLGANLGVTYKLNRGTAAPTGSAAETP